MPDHITEIRMTGHTWRVDLNFTVPAGKFAAAATWLEGQSAEITPGSAVFDASGVDFATSTSVDLEALQAAIYDKLADWK